MAKLVRNLLVLVMVAILMYAATRTKSRWVTSELTGRTYRVLDLPDAELAADALARLELAGETFLDKAERVAPGDRRLENIRTRWSQRISEVDGSSSAAYATGKRHISMCVRGQDGRIYDTDDSLFVLLHELAHIASDEWGHEETYWRDFRFLLEIADKTGVYKYRNFDDTPMMYCGVSINSNPLSCLFRDAKDACKSLL